VSFAGFLFVRVFPVTTAVLGACVQGGAPEVPKSGFVEFFAARAFMLAEILSGSLQTLSVSKEGRKGI
jgi:hypothetical protein